MTLSQERKPAIAGPPTTVDTGPDVSWWPLIVVMAGTFMTILDFFIVNVAVPSIQLDLRTDEAAIQFVVAAYGLTFAVGLVTGGRLGDMYGRRRMFVVGTALFTVASVGCSAAPSGGALIAARLVQGCGAALLTPQVLAILTTVYTAERQRKAFAVYGMVLGLAGVFGQLIGGALIQADPGGLTWRSIFLINVPVGLLALGAVRRVVPEIHPGQPVKLDMAGTVLLTSGLAALVVPLAEGRQHGWPWWTWVSLAGAGVLFALFARQQRRAVAKGGAPLIPPDLLASRSFTAGVVVTLVFLMASGSFFFVLAVYLQQARGMSALGSGLLFTAVGGGFFAGMTSVHTYGARFGRRVLAAGACVTAVGYLVTAVAALVIGPGGALPALAPGLLLVGLGLGSVLGPLAGTVLGGVKGDQAGSAAGVLSTAQELGGALGVTGVGVVYFAAAGATHVLHGSTRAFVLSLVVEATLALLAAGLVRLLPKASVE